jgi:hypothetical protein
LVKFNICFLISKFISVWDGWIVWTNSSLVFLRKFSI